jgi:hypothetical protein
MPIKPPRSPTELQNTRTLDNWLRDTEVVPSNDSVGEGILKDAAVTTPKIANLNVTGAKLATDAVSSVKIQDHAVTPAKLFQVAPNSVLGNSGSSAADVASIAGVNDRFLGQRAGVTGFTTILDADLPSTIARDSEVTSAASGAQTAAEATAAAALSAHVAAADPHTGYQKESEKDAANGYAGLNASSRIVKGIDATDDVVIDLATKGLVLKDTQGTPHYWRVTISNAGVLVTTDVGTTKP